MLWRDLHDDDGPTVRGAVDASDMNHCNAFHKETEAGVEEIDLKSAPICQQFLRERLIAHDAIAQKVLLRTITKTTRQFV
jgi:hypothetical protein